MHTKNEQLINKLIQKSEDGSINWKTTSTPSQFTLSMSNNIITVTKTITMGSARVRFVIENKDGEEVDGMSRLVTNSLSSDAELLNDLYEAARRNAYRINETIDNLLSELD